MTNPDPQTCSVEDCDRQAASRGWCKKHYRKWWQANNPRPCVAPDCARSAYARNLCRNHYVYMQRKGRLDQYPRVPLEETRERLRQAAERRRQQKVSELL